MTNAEKIAAGLAAVNQIREREQRRLTPRRNWVAGISEIGLSKNCVFTVSPVDGLAESFTAKFERETDAQYAVDGINDLPLLCDALEAAQAEIERLRAAVLPMIDLAEMRAALLMEKSLNAVGPDESLYCQQVSEQWAEIISAVKAALPAPAATEEGKR